MQAGRLDKRITIIEHTQAPDATFGDLVDTPSTVGTFWAQVEHLKGRELFQAQQTVGEVTTRFTLRWRSDIVATMTITYGGKDYDIVDIDEESLGRKVGVIVLAKARQL